MKDIHSFVRLLKNHIYATYQLHAYMRNTKIRPIDGIVIGALTVCEWLRLRLGEDIPKELELPLPSEYENVSFDMLKSLHLNRGFVVDIISLPEKDIWSLQIVEPDLGSDPGNPNQVRKPIAGRIIETNVGFCIKDNMLECGVKTIISDPENTPIAAVYRPAFVKKLYNNPDFGLKHIAILSPKLKYVDSIEQLKNVINLYKNEENQLPIIMFTKGIELKYEKVLPLHSVSIDELSVKNSNVNIDDKGNFIKKIEVENTCSKIELSKKGKKIKKNDERKLTVSGFNELRILAKNPLLQQKHPVLKNINENRNLKEEYVLPPINIHKLAAAFVGFSHVFLLNERLFDRFKELIDLNLSEGDAVILEPQCYGYNKTIYPYKSSKNTEKDIIRTIFQYPREKNFNFHNIFFLSGARDALIQGKQELEDISETQLNQWEIRLLAMQKQSEVVLSAHKEEIAKLESKNSSLKQQLVIEENKNKLLREEKENCDSLHLQELAKKDEYIAFLERQVSRPHTKKELPEWVDRVHGHHLVLHSNALKTFDTAYVNNDRLETIYDALDFMATDYWENRYGSLTNEEMLSNASKKYHRNFKLEPCKSTSVEVYADQYKIPYFKDKMGNVKLSSLEYHFKVGVKAEHLVRIYFLFDDEKKLIVVGSMPEHLKTVSFG